MVQNSLAFVHWYWFGELLWCCWLNHTRFSKCAATIKGLIFHWYWTLFMMKTLLTKNLSQKSTTCHQHNSSRHQHPPSHFCHLTFYYSKNAITTLLKSAWCYFKFKFWNKKIIEIKNEFQCQKWFDGFVPKWEHTVTVSDNMRCRYRWHVRLDLWMHLYKPTYVIDANVPSIQN